LSIDGIEVDGLWDCFVESTDGVSEAVVLNKFGVSVAIKVDSLVGEIEPSGVGVDNID